MKSAMLEFIMIIFIVGTVQTITADNTRIIENKKTPIPSNQLVGTWKYISLVGKSSEGEVYHPYGENLFGMLMYDSKGYMSMLLMNPDRPKFASGDMMKGTQAELKAAFEGFDAYCGTYIVDPEKARVIHNLHGSKFPNWVGTAQVRFFKISGDRLRITAPPILAGDVQWNFEAVLVRL
ncbi:MAG: lipocalin-like domain-containing protein [Candidatus Aminicenantes bacterium]|nr:lipocalin-like domain-containing protein [Candidatus Aminicenantes bacterium]